MVLFSFMESRMVLHMLIVLTLLWILWKGRDKILELLSLVFIVCSGELYEKCLRKIFHKL